jgi:hypothetical protein
MTKNKSTKIVVYLLGEAVGIPGFIIRYERSRGVVSWSKHIRPAIARLVASEGKKPESKEYFLEHLYLNSPSGKGWATEDEFWSWFETVKNTNVRRFEFDPLRNNFVEYLGVRT